MRYARFSARFEGDGARKCHGIETHLAGLGGPSRDHPSDSRGVGVFVFSAAPRHVRICTHPYRPETPSPARTRPTAHAHCPLDDAPQCKRPKTDSRTSPVHIVTGPSHARSRPRARASAGPSDRPPRRRRPTALPRYEPSRRPTDRSGERQIGWKLDLDAQAAVAGGAQAKSRRRARRRLPARSTGPARDRWHGPASPNSPAFSSAQEACHELLPNAGAPGAADANSAQDQARGRAHSRSIKLRMARDALAADVDLTLCTHMGGRSGAIRRRVRASPCGTRAWGSPSGRPQRRAQRAAGCRAERSPGTKRGQR